MALKKLARIVRSEIDSEHGELIQIETTGDAMTWKLRVACRVVRLDGQEGEYISMMLVNEIDQLIRLGYRFI